MTTLPSRHRFLAATLALDISESSFQRNRVQCSADLKNVPRGGVSLYRGKCKFAPGVNRVKSLLL